MRLQLQLLNLPADGTEGWVDGMVGAEGGGGVEEAQAQLQLVNLPADGT